MLADLEMLEKWVIVPTLPGLALHASGLHSCTLPFVMQCCTCGKMTENGGHAVLPEAVDRWTEGGGSIEEIMEE